MWPHISKRDIYIIFIYMSHILYISIWLLKSSELSAETVENLKWSTFWNAFKGLVPFSALFNSGVAPFGSSICFSFHQSSFSYSYYSIVYKGFLQSTTSTTARKSEAREDGAKSIKRWRKRKQRRDSVRYGKMNIQC